MQLQLPDCVVSCHGGVRESEFGAHGDGACEVIATANFGRDRLRDMSECDLPCWPLLGG